MGLLDGIKDVIFVKDPEDGTLKKDDNKKEAIANADATIIIYKPSKYEEAESICNEIKAGKAVVMIMDDLSQEDKQRMLDFLSGVIMAKDGIITKIYHNVYMCSPSNIAILEP